MDQDERKRLLEKFQAEHESFLYKEGQFKVLVFKIIWAITRPMTIAMKIVIMMVLYMYFVD